ncbi:MAG: hypothetical protein HYZ51_01645 [Candidatus Doudnabacteria bacterium]|nr:hypothetical protein [Candidatus Doudnabacteria bacterium]
MPDKTKIRYQNPSFRRKLQQARGYKRPAKKIPQSKMGIFLAKLGLGSYSSKFCAGLLLIVFVYIIFVPNFLNIKTIKIIGLETRAQENALVAVGNYLSSKPFWPQKNLLLLSIKDLSRSLTAKNFGISKVIQIKKVYPSALELYLSERYDKFLLKNLSGVYIVSNDGLIVRQLGLEDSARINPSSTISSLVTINLSQNQIYYEKQAVSDAKYFENLNEFLSLAKNQINNPILKISLQSFDRPDIEAITSAGYIIKFDINSDASKVFSQLKLLLKETGEAGVSGIKYMDMRIKDRGYICYKDAACANASPAATTTPNIIEPI